MRIVIKIVLIIASFMLLIIFTALLKEGTGNQRTGGSLGIVVMIGFVAAVRAIWKYNPEKEESNREEDNDKYKLDKK